MILQSDSVFGSSDVLRPVLPLEFQELEEVDVEQAGTSVAEPVPVEVDSECMKALVELEERLRSQMERTERQIERARQETRIEVRKELKDELEERVAVERSAVVLACERFAKDRARYFAEVEAEVVRLALAIASRVLHRETELDPLLLRGTVRVALERVQESGATTLRVPEKQVEEWKSIVADAHGDSVVVAGDGKLRAGECVLETNVGRVELGVKAQLEEIEKGFFDLLQQRPA